MSFRENLTINYELIISLIFSLLYFIISLIVVPINNKLVGFEDNISFPIIFFLASSAIIFGPRIGFMTGFIGSISFDIYLIIILKNSSFFGFTLFLSLVTGLVAFFAGYFSREIKFSSPLNFLYQLRSQKVIHNLFWNTIVSIVFYGGFLSIIISFILLLRNHFLSPDEALIFFENILFFNSYLLMIFIPLFTLFKIIFVWYYTKIRSKRLEILRKVTIKEIYSDIDTKYIQLVSARVIGKSELLIKKWNQILIEFKSEYQFPVKLRFECQGNAIYRPDVVTFSECFPNETYKLKLSIFPLKSGKSETLIKIIPWYPNTSTIISGKIEKEISELSLKPIEFLLLHQTEKGKFQYLSKTLSFGLLILTVLTISFGIERTIFHSNYLLEILIFILIIFLLEITALYLKFQFDKNLFLNWVKSKHIGPIIKNKLKTNNKLSFKERYFLNHWISPQKSLKITIYFSYWILIFLITSLIILTAINVNNNILEILGDFIPKFTLQEHLLIILLSIFLMFINKKAIKLKDEFERFGGEKSTDNISKFKLDINFSLRPLTKFQVGNATDVILKINNTFNEFGLRIEYNSFSLINPKEQILFIKRNEEKETLFKIIPQKHGPDVLTISAYQLFDKNGILIDQEYQEPFKKVDFSFRAHFPSSFGLNLNQIIRINRDFGLGITLIFLLSLMLVSFSSSFSFLGISELNSQIQSMIVAFMSGFLLIQIPVAIYYYYLRNRLQKEIVEM